jgi:hypothetical protein
MRARFNDPKFWRDRAEEARAVAERMSDEQARFTMVHIAQAYDKLASRAEGRPISPETAKTATIAKPRRREG